MDVPPGLEQGSSNKVCQLKKALYSLKQSLRAWFERLKSSKTIWLSSRTFGSYHVLQIY